MRFLAPTVLVVTLTWSMGQCSYNIDDSSLYSINFNPSSDDEALLNAPSLLQTVTMTTSHNEKYVCQLPAEVSKEEAKDVSLCSKEKAIEIVNKVFDKCYLDLEPIGRRPIDKKDMKRAYNERYLCEN